MGRGRRYDDEQKLNMKKVWAVLIAIAVIIMFIIIIINLLKEKAEGKNKNFAIEYYSVYEDGKWGVIDTKGKVIIAPQYEEMILIPNSQKAIFVCLQDVNYETGEYKSKVVDKNNKALYVEYENIELIYNHDENNNLWYEENVLKVKKEGKYGIINLEGKKLTECEYDEISPIIGTEKSFITQKEGKKGLIDNTGTVIIENKYKDIKSLTNQYENGYIVEKEDGKKGKRNIRTNI